MQFLRWFYLATITSSPTFLDALAADTAALKAPARSTIEFQVQKTHAHKLAQRFSSWASSELTLVASTQPPSQPQQVAPSSQARKQVPSLGTAFQNQRETRLDSYRKETSPPRIAAVTHNQSSWGSQMMTKKHQANNPTWKSAQHHPTRPRSPFRQHCTKILVQW